MDSLQERRSVRVALLMVAVYLVVGLGSAKLAKDAKAQGIPWRRLAWFVSAVAFTGHIGYEQFRLRSSGRTVATHASIAAALGALGLAVAANVHGWFVSPDHRGRLAVALVAWPVLIAIPAFVVAIVATAVLKRWSRGYRGNTG